MALTTSSTIQRYKDAGIYTIMLGQVPYPGPTTAECLTRPNWIFTPTTDLSCQQTSKDEALVSAHLTDSMLREVGSIFPRDTSVLLPSEFMCTGKPNCDFLDDGGSFYWKNGHLSKYGSVKLANKYLQPVMQKILIRSK
jgi:hypothetical protein